jgi:NADP-dependent 3-hydroxy acid dehydrogenase YdfG
MGLRKRKKRKKKVEKMDTKMFGVLKMMGTKMPAMKKRDIAPTLTNISSFQQQRCFKEYSRIRLVTKYSTNMHILI